ncbi:MAG: hypothetical protein ACK4F5_10570 [Aliihoeflea sp.]
MMARKYFIAGAGASAMLLLGSTAMAQTIYDPDPAVVTVNVLVQEISFLQVVQASGSMIIDDTEDTMQGQPSSGGSVFNASTGNYALVRLNTNFVVDAIRGDYTKINGIRNRDHPNYPAANATFDGTAFEWFGEAIGQNTGGILGVFPGAGLVDEATMNIIGGGGGMAMNIGGSQVDGFIRNGPNAGNFGPGSHLVAIGAATNWSRTPVSSPTLFAEPDTYSMAITLTVVP